MSGDSDSDNDNEFSTECASCNNDCPIINEDDEYVCGWCGEMLDWST